MRLGYLVHNLNDAAVERRCRMLAEGGAEIALAGFCRDAQMGTAARDRGALMLGRSHDAALAARAMMTIKHVAANAELRAFFDDCDAIIARNLEQLAIAARVADGRALIYECLDIHRALLGKSIPSRMIQELEIALLRRSDLIITSSPAFIRNHFAKRAIKGGIILLENKVLPDPIGSALDVPCREHSGRPITIGWFGMLRCKRTLTFLTDLAARANGSIEVLIAGKPSPAELPHLERHVASHPGMRFSGPYNYGDLPKLYGQCDFAWSIDWFEDGLNSQWLLPNRIYEAIAYGAIPIALADVEVGQWLMAKGAGLVVKTAEDAAARIEGMAAAELAAMRADIAAIGTDAVVCSARECRDLVGAIEALT